MNRSRIFALCGLLIFATSTLEAQPPETPPGQAKKKPKVEFDENATPLQKAIEASVERRRGKGKPAPKLKMKKCAKRGQTCEEPTGSTDGEIRHPNGKLVGKKVRTETVIEYDNRMERDDRDALWSRVMVRGRKAGERAERGGDNAGGGGRTRRAALFPDHAVNDDRDCFDTLEDRPEARWKSEAECFDGDGLIANLQEVEGGCERVDSGAFLAGDPSDGLDDACYHADGVFRQTTLQELIDEDPPEGLDNDGDGRLGEDPPNGVNDDRDCMNASGQVLGEAECFDGDQLRADLVELIDEDGPDDLDGDGAFGEDPPESTAAACSDFGTLRGLPPGLGDVVGEACDLTRAVIFAANREAMAKHGRKIYAADEAGNPVNPDDSGLSGEEKEALEAAVEFGTEKREVILNETFAVFCPQDGAELDEDGQCAVPVPESAALGAARPGGTETAAFTGSERHRAMMGFTFAPPVIEWGYEISERACVDFGLDKVCATVFLARIGYEFDVAAGLRLPVEVELSGLPDTCTRDDLSPPCALAASEVTLESAIEPLDFTVADYKAFCQEHDLADGLLIASCDRFAFPEFLDAQVPDSLIPALNDALAEVGLEPFERDGAELVAQETIFAGVQVEVVGVPLINWALDSSIDLPAMCTMVKIIQAFGDVVGDPPFTLLDLFEFGRDAATTRDVLAAIDDFIPNCQSFTTPYGFEDGILRTFPFTEGTILEVGADCAEARLTGDVVIVNGKTIPICTGIILGMEGASLGVGLGLDVRAGSNLITADWSPSGDAVRRAGESDELRYLAEPDSPISVGGMPVDVDEDMDLRLAVDNYGAGDRAAVSIDDFIYYLNTLQLTLTANLEFGGILSPIPDLASFDLFSFSVSLGDLGLPIGQHAGTGAVGTDFFVENYALDVDGYPATDDPERRDDDTLGIEPGVPGDYLVAVNNLGSAAGDFDQFTVALSNLIQDPGVALDALSFVIDPDTDGDGAVDEDPPGPEGALPEVQDEDGDGIANEDPPEDWRAEIVGVEIVEVPAHAWSTGSAPPTASTATEVVVVKVNPFRHFLTAPGLYPVRLGADSREARAHALPRQDPQDNFRLGVSDAEAGARDVVWIEILAFQDVQIAAQPATTSGKPGIEHRYTVAGTNGGNVADAMRVASARPDWNAAGCTLTTLGSDPDGCPFRAVPTAVETAWTTLDQLPGRFPAPPDGLAPGFAESADFTLRVPDDWAGMTDTTYEVELTVTSELDPAVGNRVAVSRTVVATMESMTRYVGLEIRELIAKIEAANAAGIKTGGLLPISMRPALKTNDRALARILAGNLRGAAKAHTTNGHIMEAFLRALDGGANKKIPPEMVDDWRRQGEAIIADLALAAVSPIPSAGS